MSACTKIALSLCLAPCLAATAPGVAWARSAPESSPLDLAARASELAPGEWVWAPETAPNGPVTIYIDLESQLASVYRNGVQIGVTTISSGRPGHSTPTGEYAILQKKVEHYSNLYDDAPMPYMQRLTWDGLALHAGALPGYPASHGCIRLPREFAALLYRSTEMGGTVVIGREPGDVVRPPAASADAAVYADGSIAQAFEAAGLDYVWNPDTSPSGPVSVVLSLTDREAVVMRNGVEIGRSEVSLSADFTEVFSTHVLTYGKSSDGQPQWLFAGAPGREVEAGRTLDAEAAERLQVPLAFRHALDGVLEPGSTLLITQADLG